MRLIIRNWHLIIQTATYRVQAALKRNVQAYRSDFKHM
jgi:hypothetical protein